MKRISFLSKYFVFLAAFAAASAFSAQSAPAPEIAITSPANGSNVSGEVQIVVATAPDIVRVRLSVGHGKSSANLGPERTPPFTLRWNTSRWPKGAYTLTASGRAEDGRTVTASVEIQLVGEGGTGAPVSEKSRDRLVRPESRPGPSSTLQIVSVRDHIHCAATTEMSGAMDEHYIFCASALTPGTLTVLANDQANNYPLVASFDVSEWPLFGMALSGDGVLYTAGADGILREFSAQPPFPLLRSVKPTGYVLQNIEVQNDKIYVGSGQSRLAANSSYLYTAQLNESDSVLEIDRASLATLRQFGATTTFEPNQTVAYFLKAGARIGSITNPPDLWGYMASPALRADSQYLVLTSPGPRGAGIFIYDARLLLLLLHIPLYYANTAVIRGNTVFAATEGGDISVYELSFQSSTGLVATETAHLYMPQVTGFMNMEDIEFRAVAVRCWDSSRDDPDKSCKTYQLVSWTDYGNDYSRSTYGDLLPQTFVFKY